jgi:hypothetical protein
VRKSAPSGQSGLWVENSSAVGASQNPSAFRTNHQESPKSRSGSPLYLAVMRNNPASPVSLRPPSASAPPTSLPTAGSTAPICNRRWRIPNHFADCCNFEQSLLKMVTRRKRWSTSAGSGWPRG